MKFTGSSAMKAMDTYAIRVMGIPSDELMLCAAGGAAEQASKMVHPSAGPVLIFCGSGNNGGDGIAIAALLLQKGYKVRCFMVGSRSKMTLDACKMETLLRNSGGELENYVPGAADFTGCSLIVDAMFGTGLSRQISGKYLELIDAINLANVPVLACDIASGISADSGAVMGCAVKADVTVTFNLPKTGQLLPPGTEYTGRLIVHDIGIPEEAKAQVTFEGEYVTAELVRSWLPGSKLESHKGDYGKLLLLCGSTGFTGAAALSSRAALRSGAGLVFLGIPERVYTILAAKLNEPVVFPLPCNEAGQFSEVALPQMLERLKDKSACLIGPGIGCSAETKALVSEFLPHISCPFVLDADGLNAVAGNVKLLKTLKSPVVMTPHEGEFRRLGGDLSQGRISGAKKLAAETGAVVVLKGYRTVVAAPSGEIYVNSTGNPGMAVGGSGDVLSGILTCLLGQGMVPAKAAATAVWLHGTAGDLCLEKYGRRSMLPSDMIEMLPEVFRSLENL